MLGRPVSRIATGVAWSAPFVTASAVTTPGGRGIVFGFTFGTRERPALSNFTYQAERKSGACARGL